MSEAKELNEKLEEYVETKSKSEQLIDALKEAGISLCFRSYDSSADASFDGNTIEELTQEAEEFLSEGWDSVDISVEYNNDPYFEDLDEIVIGTLSYSASENDDEDYDDEDYDDSIATESGYYGGEDYSSCDGGGDIILALEYADEDPEAKIIKDIYAKFNLK